MYDWPPTDRPAIIAPGPHLSLLDGPYLCTRLPRAALFAVTPEYAEHTFFRPALNAWGRLTGGHRMIPVRSGKAAAVMTMLKHLRAGGWLVIFPTGRIGADELEFDGAKWLAIYSGAVLHRVQLDHGSGVGKIRRVKMAGGG